MLSVSVALPPGAWSRPPIVLVHGAANSALVWKFWQRALADRGWPSYALDLRWHGNSEPIDLSHTGMGSYAEDVWRVVNELKRPPVIIGWSMGGLVAQMVAASEAGPLPLTPSGKGREQGRSRSPDRAGVRAAPPQPSGRFLTCVGLEPSPPSLRVDASLPLRTGVFDFVEYGIGSTDPNEQPQMFDLDTEEKRIALASLGMESRLARDERKRGIVIESLPCPFLVVVGRDSRGRLGKGVVEWLSPEVHAANEVSHWGLVLSRGVLEKACA